MYVLPFREHNSCLKCKNVWAGSTSFKKPGPNPTTYNASVVKIYNATNWLDNFWVKIIFLRHKNVLGNYCAGVVDLNSKVVVLAPDAVHSYSGI
jgi:hypothetical protein